MSDKTGKAEYIDKVKEYISNIGNFNGFNINMSPISLILTARTTDD